MASSEGSLDLARASAARTCSRVVVRIGLLPGLPLDFGAEDGFAVDHGGDLEIRSTQVEADAVTVQMATERLLDLALHRDLVEARTARR